MTRDGGGVSSTTLGGCGRAAPRARLRARSSEAGAAANAGEYDQPSYETVTAKCLVCTRGQVTVRIEDRPWSFGRRLRCPICKGTGVIPGPLYAWRQP